MSPPGGLLLQELTLRHGANLLARLDLGIRPGEVLTVMAPSGAGKSTLLLALIGALPKGFSATGRIVLNGQDVTRLPTAARRIGLLFQDDMLFPHLSVGQNLHFGLAPGGTRNQRRIRIEEGLAAAGLAGFACRDPATLSGGQRARVALLRALMAEPAALLLDEPFALLDASLRAQIRQATFDATRNLPVILVTHDVADAVAAGGPVLSLFGQPVRL